MAYRNIRLHPILRLIYLILRILVWFGIKVFYRRRLVLGRERLRFDGPAIVIANHPCTLMDVLNPALEIRQEMFYLANYGLFRHPVSNWLLRRLFCIPVMRREDLREGEGRNNEEAFEQSFQHLEKNGVLFIAPEGTSWMNRFVRPMKTGVARIALGADARNDWKLGVKIMPVGLSYSAPHLFRSDVVVHFGAPVYARDWSDAWTQNQHQSIDKLTQYLQDQLKTLSIHTRDEAGEQLITCLEEILQNENPLPQNAAFERSQELVKTALDHEPLREQTTAYFEALSKAGSTDAGLATALRPGARSEALRDMVFLLVGLPFFAAGYLFWFLPCFLPWWLNKKLNFYIGYSSTVKILAGLIVFPPALWGAYRAGHYFFQNGWLALLCTGVFVALGYLVEQYQDVFRRFRNRQSALRLAKSAPEVFGQLRRRRAAVLADLNTII